MKDTEVVMMRFSFPGFVHEDVVCLTCIRPSFCVDFLNRSSLLNTGVILLFSLFFIVGLNTRE